jgi:hypothetical protein
MHWHVYLRGHVVFVPTTGRLLDEPIYRNMEPVAVVPMSNTEGVRDALAAAIARGNPPAPRYSAAEFLAVIGEEILDDLQAVLASQATVNL